MITHLKGPLSRQTQLRSGYCPKPTGEVFRNVEDRVASSSETPADPYRLLVARPCVREDLGGLLELVRHVNLASMRAEREKIQAAIEQSVRALAGDLPWQQGGLFLAADLHPVDEGPSELAGGVKLQVGWGGCWKKTKQSRFFHFPGIQRWAEHEYLVYEPNDNDQYSLEFAGLTVLPRHQGKKVSQLLTNAWVLFVLLHRRELEQRIGCVASLYANLLTADEDGRYPFYEQVVRPLFGGLDYNTVDAYRYARCNARSPFLDEFLDERGGQPRASILHHLLPSALRAELGRVREQTIGCQKNLERFGFSRVDKYDVLDGGQYFETTVARLDRLTARREYLVRRVPDREIRFGAAWITFAPSARSLSEFRCARARGLIRGEEVLLGAEAYDAMLLQHHESVVVLTPPAAIPEAKR